MMKRDRNALLLVFAVAAVLRFVYLYENSATPFFSWPVLDERSIDEHGLRVARGEDADRPYFRAPLYPHVLGAVYSLTSGNSRFYAARVLQHLLGAATCVLIMIAARAAFGRPADLVAGMAAACYGPLIFYEGQILAESLFVFLNALALAVLAEGSKEDRLRPLFAGGVVLGLSAITRSNLIPFLPVAASWACFFSANRALGRRAARFAAVALPAILAIGVVTARNYMVSGELVFVASQGGSNFYLGNRTGADGLPPPTRMVYGANVPYRDAVEVSSTEELGKAVGAAVGAAGVSRLCYRAALHEIAKQPFGWIRLMFRKATLFFNDFEVKNTLDYNYYRAERSLVLRILPLSYGLVAALAVFGLVAAVRAGMNGAAWLVALYSVVFAATILLFFVCSRLRIPVVVGFLPFAGEGAVRLVRSCRGSRRLFAANLLALSVLGVFAFGDWPHVRNRDYSREHWLAGRGYYDIGRFDRAIGEFEKSAALNPGFSGNYLFLGNCRLVREEYDLARNCFETAIGKDSANSQAWNGLGVCAMRAGAVDEAADLFRKAIDAVPGFAKARTNLGFLRLRSGRGAEAAALFRESSELAPEDPETWLGLAVLAHLEGNYGERERCLARAIRLGGRRYGTLFELEIQAVEGGEGG